MSWCLAQLQDRYETTRQLVARGIPREDARHKAEWLAQAGARLRKADRELRPPACAYFVPGRIEVFGKHTDYGGGSSLLATTTRGFVAVGLRRNDAVVRITDLGFDETISFEMSPDLACTPGHWSNYVQTVARRLARNFPGPLSGAEIALASDLPPSSGMSSSSALVVTIFLVLATLNNVFDRPEFCDAIGTWEDLAEYLGTVENGLSYPSLEGDRGVGTFGGSEDHTAMLCARPGELVRYRYCPVQLEDHCPLDSKVRFVIAASGVAADKTGGAMGKYNRLSRQMTEMLNRWNEATGRDDPHIAAALSSTLDAQERLRAILQSSNHGEFGTDTLIKRMEQFAAETQEIIPHAMSALRKRQWATWGHLARRSHELAVSGLDNQTSETNWLARHAWQHGALGASAFGAGFGGSVWCMVPEDQAESFLEGWQQAYVASFPESAERATFFCTVPGPPALLLAATPDLRPPVFDRQVIL